MSTWRIGDSWITLVGATVGTGGDKAQSIADAERRKGEKGKGSNEHTEPSDQRCEGVA